MTHLRLHLSAIACALLAGGLHAAAPLRDPRISGDSSSVASGTLTVEDTATLAIAEGGTFAVDADAVVNFGSALSLANGGTGAALTDPGADRLAFWDDSAGEVAWLTAGTGLAISGTTISTTAAAGFENPMTTADDLIVGGTAGAATRLGVGTEGQVLSVVSGAVAWDDVSGGGGAPDDATYIVQVADGDLANAQALDALATGLLKNTTTTGVLSIATAGTDYVAPGAVTTSGIAMNTGALLGRTTASAGAVEEITVGSGLTLSAGTLSASGGGGSGDVVGPGSAADNALVRFDTTTGKLIQTSNVLLADSGTSFVCSAAGGISAGGTNENITLTPSGTGVVVAPMILTNSATYGPTTGIGAFRMFGTGDADTYHYIRRTSADAFPGGLKAVKARGTLASPTATQSGDGLFAFTVGGHTGSGWNSFQALLGFYASQTWTGSANGTECRIATTPNASTTRRTVATFGQDGTLDVLSTVIAPGAKIGGSNGTTTDLLASAAATLDFPSIAAGGTEVLTITVTGAATGDAVVLGLPATVDAGVVFDARVSASNTVTVRATNITAGAIDPASASYRAAVLSF